MPEGKSKPKTKGRKVSKPQFTQHQSNGKNSEASHSVVPKKQKACSHLCGFSLGKLKCYLSSFLLFYTIIHILFTCPLREPLDYDSVGKNDLICRTSHRAYGYVSYYVDPVIEKAANQYESSKVKPFVDSASESVSEFYDTYGKPIVDKYGPVVEKNVEIATVFVKQQTNALIVYSCAKLRLVGLVISENAVQFATVSCQYFQNVAYPAICASAKWIKGELQLAIQKLAIASYVNFNVYVKPILEHLSVQFHESKAGQYWSQFQGSALYQGISYVIDTILSGILRVYSKIQEVISEVNRKELNYKLSVHYKKIEQKKEFLKSELGKLFSPGFRMPNYEDLEIFKRMHKRRRVATSSETRELSTNNEPVTQVEDVSEVSILSVSVTSISTSSSVTSISVTSSSVTSSDQSTVASSVVEEPLEDYSTMRKYEKLVHNVINGANDDFTDQVAALSKETAEKVGEAVKADLVSLSGTVTSYSELHEVFQNINGKQKGEEGFASRQDYRDVLAKCAKDMNDSADRVFAKLKEMESAYTDEVLKIRTAILETLAEFSDSTLAAYSNEIINDGDDWKEWKRYNSMKQELLKARDSILEAKPASEQKVFDDISRTINVLLNEGQGYLAIMRAKGNLEFQSREKAEREAAAAAAAAASAVSNADADDNDDDDDDDGGEQTTSTSTIIVYETVGSVHKAAEDDSKSEETERETIEDENSLSEDSEGEEFVESETLEVDEPETEEVKTEVSEPEEAETGKEEVVNPEVGETLSEEAAVDASEIESFAEPQVVIPDSKIEDNDETIEEKITLNI
ncbi:DEKNAAC105609 [Brettanomyces naardenensis]|uniref:DEKNAAC105609 n=1 Tax=Brettanomyces naardenensis TaxID=13370 RepID=A0A448YTM4_BRENA|nr:DEKNAAC105609 [Brettanomyces naardenensis]